MFIEMKVSGLALDPVTKTPIVILRDSEDKSVLPIWIGLLEASAIALELEKVQLPRPMTHDLIRNTFEKLQVTVSRIEVVDLKDNTFYAALHISATGKQFAIDARPSDAIAIALRTSAPIYVNEEVLKKSREVNMDKMKGVEESGDPDKWKELLESMNPEDFGKYKM
jgi:bifunctional DNase/RNase